MVRLQASVFTQCRFYFKILYVYHASSVMTYDQCDPSLTHCEHDCFTGINLLLVGWTQQTPSWNCCENNRRNVHWKWDVVITIDVVSGMFIHVLRITKVQILHKSRKILLLTIVPLAKVCLYVPKKICLISSTEAWLTWHNCQVFKQSPDSY